MPIAASHSKPLRLAAAALEAAVAQNESRTRDLVGRIGRECTAEGLGLALIGWCDSFVDHATGGDMAVHDVRLVGIDADTAAPERPVPDTVRWAISLIEARTRMDQEAFEALLEQFSAIPDGYERGSHTLTLLESVAATIRMFPRGYVAQPES